MKVYLVKYSYAVNVGRPQRQINNDSRFVIASSPKTAARLIKDDVYSETEPFIDSVKEQDYTPDEILATDHYVLVENEE